MSTFAFFFFHSRLLTMMDKDPDAGDQKPGIRSWGSG